MKFEINSAELLSYLESIGKVFNSKYEVFESESYYQFDENCVAIDSYVDRTRVLIIKELLSASTLELMRRLAIYVGKLIAVKLLVLRNTRIHSLSIFFGLCCSSSVYIYNAITGTSSYPIPDLV